MKKLNRYSVIKKGLKREMLLLVGTGCRWKKCTFCDYYLDTAEDPFAVNKEILRKVTGQFGVLDVINSGSCLELDNYTINLIKKTAIEKNVHTIWFESHWMYREKLNGLRKFFEGIKIKFRVGIETFDAQLRNAWKKGIASDVTPEKISYYFDGVCLLVGIKGQTKDIILNDIECAKEYFEYFSVNVFNENSTDVTRDEELIEWFIKCVVPELKKLEKAEILLQNTDLGLG